MKHENFIAALGLSELVRIFYETQLAGASIFTSVGRYGADFLLQKMAFFILNSKDERLVIC